MMTGDQLEITGYRPGAIGRITYLHAVYYARHWGFGQYFERKVATEMSEFLGRFDPLHDGFWLAVAGDEIVGSIAIDGLRADTEGAHLRWFIVDGSFRGTGVGRRLLEEAVDFSKDRCLGLVYLWTFAGLEAARHLYEAFGFRLCKEHEDTQWGRAVTEQQFELLL